MTDKEALEDILNRADEVTGIFTEGMPADLDIHKFMNYTAEQIKCIVEASGHSMECGQIVLIASALVGMAIKLKCNTMVKAMLEVTDD